MLHIANNFHLSTFTSQDDTSFAWVSESCAITYKLERLLGKSELILLSQAWSLPNWWERRVLQINSALLRRDILMQAKKEPFWFARTMIPLKTYTKDPIFFNRLN